MRVKVVRSSYTDSLNITGIKVKGYTTCTVSNEEVSNGGNEGYIDMKKNGEYYEANFVPGFELLTNAFDIMADNSTAKAILKAGVTLVVGNVHAITITMNASGPRKIDPDADSNFTVKEAIMYLSKTTMALLPS